jgi:glycosyltransferase involved in cell wall biosynthesis
VKICYLCADLGISLHGYNGASSYIRGLVRALAKLGHEVSVIAPAAERNGDLGVPVIPIPAPDVFTAIASEAGTRPEINGKAEDRGKARLFLSLRHLWHNVAVEQVLREILPVQRPDLLYERYSPFSVAGGVMAKRMGVPHILHVNAPLAWEGARYRQQALQEAAETLEQKAFATASLIVTTCQELRDILVADGVPEPKVAVVPCGVDAALFTPQGPRYHQEHREKITIGFVGSLKPWHGIEVLAEAFRQLAVDPHFHLLVVGDGPLITVLQSLAQELPQQVTLVGAVPQAEVAPYVRAIDIAVAPYPRLERFYFSPLKVLEYLAAGRAVVASNIGQLSDLIRHGVTGLLVPPGDARALAEASRRLAADERLRQTLGAQATVEIQRAHTWTHRAAMVAELAKRICSPAPIV